MLGSIFLYILELATVIQDIYEVHHFENKSNTLFKAYNETLFETKRTAKQPVLKDRYVNGCFNPDIYNTLFKAYNETFFKTKRTRKTASNKVPLG